MLPGGDEKLLHILRSVGLLCVGRLLISYIRVWILNIGKLWFSQSSLIQFNFNSKYTFLNPVDLVKIIAPTKFCIEQPNEDLSYNKRLRQQQLVDKEASRRKAHALIWTAECKMMSQLCCLLGLGITKTQKYTITLYKKFEKKDTILRKALTWAALKGKKCFFAKEWLKAT